MQTPMVTMICCAAAMVAAAPDAAELVIAEEGRTDYTIVLPDEPSPEEQHAAEELAHYLAEATGADLPVVSHSEAPAARRVLVGDSALTRQVVGEAAIGDLEGDAFLVRTLGDDLVMVGAPPRGTLYAAYSFLEREVGCRWFNWYGEEHVPEVERLVVPDVDRRETPAFVARDIYFLKYGFPDQMRDFLVRSRVTGPATGGLLGQEGYGGSVHRQISPGVHTLFHYVPPEEHFDEHPEYFGYTNGRRQQRQLCFTNPELRRTLTAAVVRKIEQVGGVGNLSVSAQDTGGPFCDCPQCTALVRAEEATGAPLYDYIKQLADTVRDDWPDIYITTLAYRHNQSETPPKSMHMPGNVIIIFAPIDGNFAAALEHPSNARTLADITAWPDHAEHLWVWYYSNPYGRGAGFPIGNLGRLAQDMRLFERVGVEGFFIEHDTGIPQMHLLADLQTWLLAKLLWAPHRDVDALIADFTDHYYGPAAPMIRDYVERLESATSAMSTGMTWNASPGQYRYLTPDLLIECQRLFDAAEEAVAGDQTLLHRVRIARMSVDRATLFFWSDVAAEDAHGLSQAELAQRYRETFDRALEERIRPEFHDRLRPWVADLIDLAAKLTAPKPLPPKLEGIDPQRIVQVSPMVVQPGHGTGLREDAQAAMGICATRETDGELPLNLGVYDWMDRETVARRDIEGGEITSPGYSLYRIGSGALSQHCGVWITRSWRLQVPLEGAYTPDAPDREWEIYASLRFEGPAYPHGGEGEQNRVFLDRIVLVAAQ
ncbi:MAG: DUF4838 domain-containing protein [Armatimonadota bacterium]|nr:DUF4838 domain-containing protein [Armatimonadota bacterium]